MKKNIKEYYGQRPDTSGNRGGSAYRKPHQSGAEFPYDGSHPPYGSVDIRYGKGSKKSTPTTSGPNDDKPKFEAIGIPFNIGRSADGGGGSTGGRVQPGTSGEWSNKPKGDGWDKRITDDEIDKAGKFHEKFVKEFIEESFISLRSTPEQEFENGLNPHDIVRNDDEEDFNNLSSVLRKTLEDMDDHEIVSTLFDTDKDGFSKILSSLGKEALFSIYERWVEDTLNSDNNMLKKVVMKLSGDF